MLVYVNKNTLLIKKSFILLYALCSLVNVVNYEILKIMKSMCMHINDDYH